MHYNEFIQKDTKILAELIEAFPFSTITTNGIQAPLIAYAPLLHDPAPTPWGSVTFHLARANPVADVLGNGSSVTIAVHGPSGHISPSWYRARFPHPKIKRNQVAPTYDYINATLSGWITVLSEDALTEQIASLVRRMEATVSDGGWSFSEIEAETFARWRGLIVAYRVTIINAILIAKLSQDQKPADRTNIACGLRERGKGQDFVLAELVENFDETPESLARLLRGLKFIGG